MLRLLAKISLVILISLFFLLKNSQDMPLIDAYNASFAVLSANSPSELPDDLKTASSGHEFLTGRVLSSDIAVIREDDSLLRKKTAQDEQIFQIASITKTFTAVAITHTIVDNRDDFISEDPLSTPISLFRDKLKPEAQAYFDKLAADPNIDYENITLRHVLNHSSGVTYPPFFDKFRQDQTKEIRLSSETNPISNEEGFGKFSYSDANYNFIIGPIIEAVTGKDFSQVVKEEIINRYGLNNTFLFDEMQYDVEQNRVMLADNPDVNVAQGYDYHDGKYTSTQDFHYDSAAGGIYSNAADVAKFYQKLLSGSLSRNTDFEEIFFDQKNFIASDLNDSYGLGIRKLEHQGVEYFSHGGSAFGFNSYVMGSRNISDKSDVKVASVMLSYENLTRGIATDLLDSPKYRKDAEGNKTFFVDEELTNKMTEISNKYALKDLIEMRQKIEKKQESPSSNIEPVQVEKIDDNKQNVR